MLSLSVIVATMQSISTALKFPPWFLKIFFFFWYSEILLRYIHVTFSLCVFFWGIIALSKSVAWFILLDLENSCPVSVQKFSLLSLCNSNYTYVVSSYLILYVYYTLFCIFHPFFSSWASLNTFFCLSPRLLVFSSVSSVIEPLDLLILVIVF